MTLKPSITFNLNLRSFCHEYISSDTPLSGQIYFQDPATVSMEGILSFNNHLSFLLIIIISFVAWFMFFTLYFFVEQHNKYSSKFVHSKELEIVWTSIPALILLILSIPSFTLLYSMDEAITPDLSLKILGHQWFWSYEMSEFKTCALNESQQSLKYSSYMMVLEALPGKRYSMDPYFRLLDTNKRLVLPILTHIRLLISAADVLHSWTVPSFGLKVDACPGRLNQVNLFIKRGGLFFGQCSEICGVNHGFMPIAVLAVTTPLFHSFVGLKLDLMTP
jgi:cytochrome c oxidase subunit 2